MRFLDFLLESKLLKVLKGNNAVVTPHTTMALICRDKACTCNNILGSKRDIDTGIFGPTGHPTRLAGIGHKVLNPILSQATQILRIITTVCRKAINLVKTMLLLMWERVLRGLM